MSDFNNNCLNLNIRVRFHQKFHEILKKDANVLKNIWLLNEIIFPLKSDIRKIKKAKIVNESKYAMPKSDISFYSSLIKNKNDSFQNDDHLVDSSNFSLEIKEALEEIDTHTLANKKHVHTLYAFNKECLRSPPLIIFPQSE